MWKPGKETGAGRKRSRSEEGGKEEKKEKKEKRENKKNKKGNKQCCSSKICSMRSIIINCSDNDVNVIAAEANIKMKAQT